MISPQVDRAPAELELAAHQLVVLVQVHQPLLGRLAGVVRPVGEPLLHAQEVEQLLLVVEGVEQAEVVLGQRCARRHLREHEAHQLAGQVAVGLDQAVDVLAAQAARPQVDEAVVAARPSAWSGWKSTGVIVRIRFLHALRVQRRIAQREHAALADAEQVDRRHAVRAADVLDAVVEVAVDVVLERQPAVAARRAAPVDRVEVHALREQVAQQRAVFLQVGHRVAADQAVGDQHRHARPSCLRGRLVAVQRRLVLAEHLLLVGGGDLHVLVLDALQQLLAAGQLEVQVVELGDRLRGRRTCGSWASCELLRCGALGGAGCGARARPGCRCAIGRRRRWRRAGAAPRGAAAAARAAARSPWRCSSSTSLRVGMCAASHQASAILRSCSWRSDAARSMRRCASTNSSERCTSINVSLATASQRSVRPRQVACRRSAGRRQRLREALEGAVPGLLHHGLVGRHVLVALQRQLLQLEQLAVEVPQRGVARAFEHALQRRVEHAGARPGPRRRREHLAQLARASGSSPCEASLAKLGPLGDRRLPGVAQLVELLLAAASPRGAAAPRRPARRSGKQRLPHRLLGGEPVARSRPCSARSWEHHHLPDRLALVQQVEAFVDLVERQPPAHQPVHRHAAAAVQRHVARQVARRHAGADVAALDACAPRPPG